MKNKILTFAFVLFLLVFIHTFVQADDDTTQWADFSNAEYNITITDYKANLEISGVSNYTSETYISYVITSEPTDESTLTFEDYAPGNGFFYTYDSTSNTLSLPIAKYVELNQDLYLYISQRHIQESESETKILVKGEKLARPSYVSDYRLFWRFHFFFF